MDDVRIPVSGDPFYAAGRAQDNRPCACIDGWVYLGHLVESDQDLDGEVEVIERVPCRHCVLQSSLDG